MADAATNQGHIAGAQFVVLRPTYPPRGQRVNVRHPLPESATLLAQLRAWGIDNRRYSAV
jgi:3-mercaptopyruvate sulfurtransferase SseA